MLEFVISANQCFLELDLRSTVHLQPFSPNIYPVRRASFSDRSIKLTLGAETAGGYADG